MTATIANELNNNIQGLELSIGYLNTAFKDIFHASQDMCNSCYSTPNPYETYENMHKGSNGAAISCLIHTLQSLGYKVKKCCINFVEGSKKKHKDFTLTLSISWDNYGS